MLSGAGGRGAMALEVMEAGCAFMAEVVGFISPEFMAGPNRVVEEAVRAPVAVIERAVIVVVITVIIDRAADAGGDIAVVVAVAAAGEQRRQGHATDHECDAFHGNFLSLTVSEPRGSATAPFKPSLSICNARNPETMREPCFRCAH